MGEGFLGVLKAALKKARTGYALLSDVATNNYPKYSASNLLIHLIINSTSSFVNLS